MKNKENIDELDIFHPEKIIKIIYNNLKEEEKKALKEELFDLINNGVTVMPLKVKDYEKIPENSIIRRMIMNLYWVSRDNNDLLTQLKEILF